jgi:hypothetical protein
VAADEFIQIAAPNNGSTNRPVLANSFNAIAVGRSDGQHPRGTLALDGPYAAGRTKPDLVAPLGVTSSTAPAAASAVALLLEAGRNPALSTDPIQKSTVNRDNQIIRNAERSEVVKAALMAGAERVKDNGSFADINDYRVDPAERSANGLDKRFGAGQLNVYHSYHIIAAGEQNSREDDPAGEGSIEWTGWDFDPYFGGSSGSNAEGSYFITSDQQRRMLHAALVWNIDIDGGTWSRFDDTATLYDMGLFLHDVTDPQNPRLVASSASASDNTENLWVPLAPGRTYRLQVKPGQGQAAFRWDYAIAWRMTAPSDADGDSMPDDWEVYYGLNHLDAGTGLGDSGIDTDADGVPDDWEVFHGLSHLDPGDAAADPDGDWAANLEEFRQGSDPTSPDTFNINIYGAAAQQRFWKDAADEFLISRGCTAVAQDDYDAGNGITRGTCGTGTVYIRYSAASSFEGIYAVRGLAGSKGSEECPSPFQRLMVDEATCAWDGPGGGSCAGRSCREVTLGGSAVDGSTITQKSAGRLKGPNGGGLSARAFPAEGIDTRSLTSHPAPVVPFAFFANGSVANTKCLGPGPVAPTPAAYKAVSTWGFHCCDPDGDKKSADCIGYYACVGGSCSGGARTNQGCSASADCPDVEISDTRCERIPMDTISRIMAVNIFSGQVWYWSDFGAWYPENLPVAACLRHAGSGAHAALDWAVMRASAGDWGWPLVEAENAGNPTVWFNEEPSDQMKCIDELAGAIGYAAADELEDASSYPNVCSLKYNGVEAGRAAVRNGEYDFYANHRLFAGRGLTRLEEELIAFASDPANIPAAKAGYWAVPGEMWFNRGNDRAYPGFVGAAAPQLP